MGALPDFDEDQCSCPCLRLLSCAGTPRLRLLVAVEPDHAVCDVFVEELGDRVELEVLACHDGGTAPGPAEVEIYLHTPLGERAVIDLSSGRLVAR